MAKVISSSCDVSSFLVRLLVVEGFNKLLYYTNNMSEGSAYVTGGAAGIGREVVRMLVKNKCVYVPGKLVD